MTKGLILLSGGLDSLVSLDIAFKTVEIKLAVIFNYGQKSYKEEKDASIKIAKHYGIEHKIIRLPYLKELTNNSYTNSDNSKLDDINSVWIPNRNGLFLNIACSICESLDLDTVVFGANKEEAQEFPDNSKKFVDYCNKLFEFSSKKKVKVLAPCLQFDKIQIINYAIDNSLPLNFIKSCYNSNLNTGRKHCGKCMSCKLLYEAILKSKKPELVKEIF